MEGKVMKNNIFILILNLILLLSLNLQAVGIDHEFVAEFSAVEIKSDTIKDQATKSDWLPLTSINFELGGRFTLSINVDFRKRENFAFSIGNSYWFDNEEHRQSLLVPYVMAYYLCGSRHRIEVGGGTGTLISTYKGFGSIMFFGNIGYRYQQKKGLIFRIGFTPWVSIPIAEKTRFWATPWAGISLGYSF
jgi:hypothetical protein